MTNKPELTEGALTPEFIQELYSVAVSCEIAERSGAYMASFDLLCKADDAVGIAHVVRKLIDMVRANDVELRELRRNYLALRGEIEDVQAQLYEAENRNEADAAELQERRKADSAEPFGYLEVFDFPRTTATLYPEKDRYATLPLYAAPPPAPVDAPDGLRLALSNAGIAAPESDEMLFALHERYVQDLVTWVKDRKPFRPAPVVPDDGRAEFEAWMLKKWGRERQEYDFAMGKFLHGENYADSYTRHMWKAWTESRAAMLQSKYRDLSQPVDPQISEYEKIMLQAGNSPVIPDGWISCSERMPDKLIPVIVMYEDGEMWSAMWNGNRWDDGTEYPDPHSVTHWREMPAAPQQEVNRG